MLENTLLAGNEQRREKLYKTLQASPKRIVFADGDDLRVLQAAEQLVAEELIAPILLGDKAVIKELAEENDICMEFINVINPETSSDLVVFEERLEKVEKYRGRVIANPREIVSNPHNFAAMMVQYGQADGMIAGNKSLPASVFRAVKNFIKPLDSVPSLFGAAVMVAPQMSNMGSEGVLFLADCGINPDPSADELASFGLETGRMASNILTGSPKVAFLSHSSHGSMHTDSSKKMATATSAAIYQAGKESLGMNIIGEVQADVALCPQAAELKSMGKGATSSDVLVFPNLDAAHISVKLLKYVGGASYYGQLILGLTKPAAQVPRTVTAESIAGTALLVGMESNKGRTQLYEWK